MAFVGSDTERPYDSLVALLQLAQVAAETDASPKQPVSSPKPVTAQPKAPNAAAGRPMPECPVLADPDGTTRGKKSAVKRPWSPEEDKKMRGLVNQYGPRKWSAIASHLPGRVGKQCRERWQNHLRPDVNKGAWTETEEKLLLEAHAEMGNRWAEISKMIPGRTDNAVKNYWNGLQSRKRKSRPGGALSTNESPAKAQRTAGVGNVTVFAKDAKTADEADKLKSPKTPASKKLESNQMLALIVAKSEHLSERRRNKGFLAKQQRHKSTKSVSRDSPVFDNPVEPHHHKEDDSSLPAFRDRAPLWFSSGK